MQEIKFDKNSFLKFNQDDQLGLFDDRIRRVARILDSIDQTSISLFDYDQYVQKLQSNLFVKYQHLVLTHDNQLFGVIENERFMIKRKLNGWFEKAVEEGYANTSRL
jgi:hypothetical protein